MIPSQILLKLMNLRTLSHMQLFKFLNSNSVDISFQTLLFQTIVHSLVVRNFTSFHSAGNSTMWRHHHIMQRLMVKLNLQTIKQTVKQTDKQLFKKAERDGEDPWLALLDHRNTPTEGLGTSPAQRLISRRTRTLIPTAASVLRPEIIPDSTEQLEWKRREATFYHDRIAKQLPELEIGQEFRIAPLQKNQTWKQATCVEKLSDRS